MVGLAWAFSTVLASYLLYIAIYLPCVAIYPYNLYTTRRSSRIDLVCGKPLPAHCVSERIDVPKGPQCCKSAALGVTRGKHAESKGPSPASLYLAPVS
ncbi:hypothetical protein BDW67DRAFT_153224 [Aspergillus spinulosporus]